MYVLPTWLFLCNSIVPPPTISLGPIYSTLSTPFTWNVYESYPLAMNMETSELLLNAKSVGDGDARHLGVHESVNVNDFALHGCLVA